MMDEDFDIREEQLSSSEKEFENALRPLAFNDFSGQQQVVENLEVFVEAAKYRGEPLDHVLLHGPPGLGKTTLYSTSLAIWQVFLLLWRRTTYCSSTRFTACHLLLRSISIQRWRITALTS